MTTKRRMITGATVAAVIVVGIALVVFKPWLLFVNTEVNDTIPSVAAVTTPADSGHGTTESNSSSAAPSGPVIVSQGEFISHEHTTTGTARIYRLPDGSHQLALENLQTSNGPDVRVWLSKGPVIEGTAGWTTAGQHPHLDVAPIKGNLGNQVYELPADFNPEEWPTVDLWCEDFAVSFGAAALSAT